ncbi:MAG: hypothetical protein GY805_25610, partial [Chloroflexi bacterium]|nr:hypothetical protein [Chloroflexota bacterium]
VFFENTGSWYIALSNGSGFASYTKWDGGHGIGSTDQIVGDLTGDGKDDAIVYFGQEGTLYVANSTGANFAPYKLWVSGYGDGNLSQIFLPLIVK